MSDNLREQLVKLANSNPDGIREYLVPLLKEAGSIDGESPEDAKKRDYDIKTTLVSLTKAQKSLKVLDKRIQDIMKDTKKSKTLGFSPSVKKALNLEKKLSALENDLKFWSKSASTSRPTSVKDLSKHEQGIAKKMYDKGYTVIAQITTINGDFGEPIYVKGPQDLSHLLRSFPSYEKAKTRFNFILNKEDFE